MDKICSKANRHFLMGVSIVAIILCHITQFVGTYKGIRTFIGGEFFFSSAAIGVDIFFFLSLVGLGFSFEKSNLINFYWRRIKRIFPVYVTFLFVALFWFYQDVSSYDRIVLFLQQISGISALKFVLERIEWYVPSLLILYALYPLAFLLVKRVYNNRRMEILFLFVSILAAYPLSKLFVNLFAMRLPLYYLAILTYFYIRNGESEKTASIFLIAVACSFFVQNQLISYACIIPLFLFVLNRYIVIINETRIGRAFSWVGKYTLEIYLAQVIATKYFIRLIPSDNIIVITIIVFAMTSVIAFLFNMVQRMLDSIGSQKNAKN